MSVNKFKVGDKVRVREGLVADEYYDGVYCSHFMACSGGQVLTIDNIFCGCYRDDVCGLYWAGEMLEPVEKTLYNLEKGDIVLFNDNGERRKVLAVIDSRYLLSYPTDFTSAGFWYTVDALKYYECTVQQPKIETIEINGKKYKKADVEEAIKDLEAVDQIMWPGCQICGKPAKTVDSEYCQGTYCDGKPMTYPSRKKPHTKKKLTREMIKARRKKGRRKGNR